MVNHRFITCRTTVPFSIQSDAADQEIPRKTNKKTSGDSICSGNLTGRFFFRFCLRCECCLVVLIHSIHRTQTFNHNKLSTFSEIFFFFSPNKTQKPFFAKNHGFFQISGFSFRGGVFRSTFERELFFFFTNSLSFIFIFTGSTLTQEIKRVF